MSGWVPTVSTLYRNVEVLAASQSPRSAPMRLGLSWGFGLPRDGRSGLTEFSFPLRPAKAGGTAEPLSDLLRSRAGLDIRRHDDPRGTGMHDYLRATGEPAVAVVDSFYLPYRPAYGRVHSSRTVIVQAAEGNQVRVDDCWEPAYRGMLSRHDLDAARQSQADADPLLEPVFSGVRADAEWFTVSVEPIAVADAAQWAAATADMLIQEITGSDRTADASFGLAALREMVEMLAAGYGTWQAIPRRTLALVLRAELSSRRYLCTLLRNAVALAGVPALAGDVESYQEGLRHFQAARDVMVKSLRRCRPEYDAFVLARCRDALANEERLLAALAPLATAGGPAASVREEPVRDGTPQQGTVRQGTVREEAGAWPG